MQLHFDSITTSPHYEKAKKVLDTTGSKKLRFIILFFVGVIVFFGLIFMFPPLVFVLVPGVFIAIAVILVRVIPKASRDWAEYQKTLSTFAAENGFTYHEAPFAQYYDKNLPDVVLSLPFRATLRTNSGFMTGKLHGCSFSYLSGGVDLPDYKGMSAQASNGQESRSIVALSITLPIVLPKLFIDSKRNNVSGFESIPGNLKKREKYDLESTFPTKFRVYAEENDQINVLSILTPEVMDKLMSLDYYDIWISGTTVTIYALATPTEYFAAIPSIFTTADMLLTNIDHIARKLR